MHHLYIIANCIQNLKMQLTESPGGPRCLRSYVYVRDPKKADLSHFELVIHHFLVIILQYPSKTEQFGSYFEEFLLLKQVIWIDIDNIK